MLILDRQQPYTVQTVSTQWETWRHKICDRLKVDSTIPLNKQPLQRPWFVVPVGSEFSPLEIEELLATVRNYLLPLPTTTVGDVKTRLLNLPPDNSLPFLYSMRYVAYSDGRSHNYWPAFRKWLLQDRLDYSEVAIRLGATTSELWLRLYEHTGGALYYPSEGSRHIKWPLAHAGLHSDDKRVLTAFGIALCQVEIELFESAIRSEVDQFLLNFKDWLADNPLHQESSIGKRLLTLADESSLLAELSQKWLARHQIGIEQAALGASTPHKVSIPINRNLVYQASTNQVGLSFSIGISINASKVDLEWEGKRFEFLFSQTVSTGKRTYWDRFVPVYRTDWPTRATFHIGDDDVVVQLPSMEDARAIVFDADTGERTRRWQFGHMYYLLIASDRINTELAGVLFSDWYELKQPQGDWQKYRLLWVRTFDLPAWTVGKVQTAVLKRIQDIEESAQNMGLPSFGHHYRMRPRMVGRQCGVSIVNGMKVPAYKVSADVYVELAGVWTEDTVVKLKQYDGQSGQYETIAELTIPKELTGKPQLVELFNSKPQPTVYIVEASHEQVTFQVVSDDGIEDSCNRTRVKIDAYDAESQTQLLQSPSRHSADELLLKVKAWPNTNLIIEVSHSTAQHTYRLPIQMNEDGCWSQKLDSLPVRWDDFPPGNIVLRCSWRGLFLEELILHDRGHLSAKLYEFKLQPDCSGTHFGFSCCGVLQGTASSTSLRGLLLPSPPWSKQPREFSIKVGPDGYFQGSVIVSWQPHWLVIEQGEQDDFANSTLLAIGSCQDSSVILTADVFSITQVINEPAASSWPILASRISEIPHPPDINPYLACGPLLATVNGFASSAMVQPRWRYFPRCDAWPTIRDSISRGDTVALFRSAPAKHGDPQVTGAVKLREMTGQGNVSSLEFQFDHAEGTTRGAIVFGESSVLKPFLLRPERTLRGCTKCRLIVPPDLFEIHRPPYSDMPSCTAEGLSLQEFPPRANPPDCVVIGVFSDPRTYYTQIHNELRTVADRGIPPSQTFTPLLNGLRSFVPKDQDRFQWLRDLVSAMPVLTDVLFTDRTFTLAEIGEISRKVKGFELAHRLIIQWIVDTLAAGT